jgi:hypothetical protein
MKLEIEINDGDDLSFLCAIRGLSAVMRDHAPNAGVRRMAGRIHQALESVLRRPSGL